MKKLLPLMMLLLLCGCGIKNNVSLRGFYQSEFPESGFGILQISIVPEEKSFIQYIDNREVNNGTYEELGDKKYRLVGDTKTFSIELTEQDTFEVTIQKLNNGLPIVLKNMNKIPTYFENTYEDVETYRGLLTD